MIILFMGTPDFAEESLRKLVEAGYEICGVVTNPDRPSGRGMKMIYSPVKEYALSQNFTIYQPEKITNNNEFKDLIRSLEPDIACVVAYGKILPKSFLKIPRLGCINVHGSLLPKYRGAAPIQWAVLNGDKVTGITTMYMDEKMDTGDMILKEEVEIGDDETTGELWDRLKVIGADLLVETLKQIENGTAPREKQGDDFSIAPMLDKEMSKIDWTKKASEIKNLIRGLNPIMGGVVNFAGKKIKFWKVQILEKEEIENIDSLDFDNIVPGTVVFSDAKKGLFIKTADNKLISVLEIQGENAKRMSIGDFLRGNTISALDKFE